jgi:hypothetical protein
MERSFLGFDWEAVKNLAGVLGFLSRRVISH